MAVMMFSSCKKEEGCIDSSATNYNSEAETDDGSCIYADTTDISVGNGGGSSDTTSTGNGGGSSDTTSTGNGGGTTAPEITFKAKWFLTEQSGESYLNGTLYSTYEYTNINDTYVEYKEDGSFDSAYDCTLKTWLASTGNTTSTNYSGVSTGTYSYNETAGTFTTTTDGYTSENTIEKLTATSLETKSVFDNGAGGTTTTISKYTK